MDLGKVTIELCQEDRNRIDALIKEMERLRMQQNQAYLMDEDTCRKFAESIKHYIITSLRY